MPSMPPSPHRALVAFQISSLFLIEPWRSLKFAESERHLVWCRSDHEGNLPFGKSHDSIHTSPASYSPTAKWKRHMALKCDRGRLRKSSRHLMPTGKPRWRGTDLSDIAERDSDLYGASTTPLGWCRMGARALWRAHP